MSGKTLLSRWRAVSLRRQIILVVCLVALLPFTVGQWISNRQLTRAISQRDEEQALLTLNQMEAALDITLAGYDDLLYQLYADQELSLVINELADDPDDALLITRLQNRLRGVTFSRPALRAITVIYGNGLRLFYDRLTLSTRASSWMSEWDIDALYRTVVDDGHTCYLPASFGKNTLNEQVPLFHMAHASFDYRQIGEHRAIIVLSLDETLLSDLLNPEDASADPSLRLIADAQGQILSAPCKRMLGQTLSDGDAAALVRREDLLSGAYLSAAAVVNERTGWTLYQVRDETPLHDQLSRQFRIMLLFVAVSAAVLVSLIVLLTRLLTRSLTMVTDVMKRAGRGDLSARVPLEPPLPEETALIAERFNTTMDQLAALMDEVRESSIRQKNAEIIAMEAQLNPHFLYNTLDTINWMAIDHEAYDISNAIASLARILRYGVDRSDPVVTVRQEVDWINHYLGLSQIRLKNSLDFRLRVDEATLELPIRKLLFQPFVENAIIHAYAGVNRAHTLEIDIDRESETLRIRIRDNGKGMSEDQVRSLFTSNDTEDKHHLGVRLALERIRLYYGDRASVFVSSELDVGTTIELHLPMEKKTG